VSSLAAGPSSPSSATLLKAGPAENGPRSGSVRQNPGGKPGRESTSVGFSVLARLGAEGRLWWSAAALSLWLLSLFVGVTLGGFVHLLVVAILVLRPWTLEEREPPPASPSHAHSDGPGPRN
jgi:hypothetical protein